MRAYRVDSNQKDIVTALRNEGFAVQHLHSVGAGCPDILVGYEGINVLIEIKEGDGKLTPAQVLWHKSWQGQVAIAKDKQEAIEIVKYAVKQETEKKEKSGRIRVAHNNTPQRGGRDSVTTSPSRGTDEVQEWDGNGGELAHDSGEAKRGAGSRSKPWTASTKHKPRVRSNAEGSGEA